MDMPLLTQIKKRRLQLGLKQHDMYLRVGLSRQQYQRLESQGNPRLDTLTLVAQGLNSEILLIPKEKLEAVLQLLSEPQESLVQAEVDNQSLVDNPWQGLLND